MQRVGVPAWINIDGSSDPGYRYKMPQVDVFKNKVAFPCISFLIFSLSLVSDAFHDAFLQLGNVHAQALPQTGWLQNAGHVR